MDKTALFNLTYGVYIVSGKDGDRNIGCVVNSVFQVTSSPSTLAVSINKENYTNSCILKSGRFAVSILSESVNPSVIGTFGFSSSREEDKFKGLDFITTEKELPVLTSGVCGYLECKIINSMDCFTHTLIFAEITGAENLSKEPPMTYAYYHKVIKGKAPKKAPTYVEDEKQSGESKKYVCSICGYEYPGSLSEFEALPDSYECPLCSAPKSAFELKSDA